MLSVGGPSTEPRRATICDERRRPGDGPDLGGLTALFLGDFIGDLPPDEAYDSRTADRRSIIRPGVCQPPQTDVNRLVLSDA